MDQQRGSAGWLPRALRGLEARLGADREGRTLWVWVVPAATVVITFSVLVVIGIQGSVGLDLTIPMALTLSLFLGSLSAFYLTAASADERDVDDDPDDRREPVAPPLPPPPAGETAPVPVPIPTRPERPIERPAIERPGAVAPGEPWPR